MSAYDDCDIGHLVPACADVLQALQRYVPNLAESRKVRLISNYRHTIVSVQDQVIVKYGSLVREVEAETMQFVSSHTSVPIPKVHGTFTNEDGITFIVMEFVRGETLEAVWTTLSKDDKQELALQFGSYIDNMRKLKGEYVGALGRRSCNVVSLQGPYTGPFNTENELNETMLRDFEREVPGYFGSVLKKLMKDNHQVVFSHSDFSMRNIMVLDKQIVAVLDWESAGFFPEYWDYAHSFLGVRWNNDALSDYALFLQESLQSFPLEAATISLMVTKMI